MFPSLDQVTAIVKTFERPESLEILIRSIRRFCPQLRILVGDDSVCPTPRDDVEYHRFEPDVGASAVRNRLVEQVRTPYFLQLDDDFEFTRCTRIEKLVDAVVNHDVDLAAGEVENCKRRLGLFLKRKPTNFFGLIFGLIKVHGDHLEMQRGYHATREKVRLCDIVPQFFVARRDVVLPMGGWDADPKTEEHEEFFVRAQRHGLRISHCPEVRVLHWNARPRGYAAYRNRNYQPLAAKKMGIRSWTNLDGVVRHFLTEPESQRRPQ